MSGHISRFSPKFPTKFLFRPVTWYLRISLRRIWRFCLWDVMPLHCGGYLHILELSKVLPLWVPSHPGREYYSVFCIIEIYSLPYFLCDFMACDDSSMRKVRLVKRGRRNVVRYDVFHRCCWRFLSSGMQHCVIGRVVSSILKVHSAVKTPGTASPTTQCHGPEDWYLQVWNLSQTNERNSQIQRVVLTDRWKVWL